MKILKVISGGQTGVDRGGLEAAIELGLRHGGWCPRGRRAEDGRVPDIFQLTETLESDYRVRTSKNILEADVTLVLYWGERTPGTQLTIQEAFRLKKVCHHVDLLKYPSEEYLIARLGRERGSVLNVAGPRESKHPGAQAESKRILLKVLKETV